MLTEVEETIIMGVSFDLIAYLLTSVGRTMYLLAYGVMHHLQKPTPLDVGSPEYMDVVRTTLSLRV